MRKVYSLNQNWKFRKVYQENDRLELSLEKSEEVTIPHTWNQDFGTDRGLYLYERILEIDHEHKDDSIYLEFLGANSVCRVYINDIFIGEHRGGYSTFRFDITNAYHWGEINFLRVYVDNSPFSDVSPLTGDFTIYGGLYRPVNLICVASSHFSLLYYGSLGVIIRSMVDDKGIGIVDLEYYVVNGENIEVEWAIEDSNGNLVVTERTQATKLKHQLQVENCHLWQGKEDPYLYGLKARLLKEEKEYDGIELSFGFRTCQLNPEKGFYLNGHHTRIHGVSKHQDYGTIGNAIELEHIKKNFELIHEIGANSVRLSHYQHSQETYDMCDRLGYITWAEIPMLAMPNQEGVLDNATEQLKELIYQNAHHPSICFWGIQNEIAMGGESLAMYSGVHMLNDVLHNLLPQSISASANMYYVKNDSNLNFITDMLGYNLYYGWYYGEIEELSQWFDKFHDENPNVALGLSEYGADCNLKFHSESPIVKDYTEEFQALYHEKTYQIIESKPYLWGSYLWNLFDFGSAVRDEGGTRGQNCKGLVTIDRKIKKDAFYFYKAKWSNHAFIHICEKRFINRSNSTMSVKVYSNLSNITLYINGEKFSSQEGESVFCFNDVPLNMGKNNVIAIGRDHEDECRDEAIFIRQIERDETYVYVDPRPGLNVANWFTQEKGEMDFFPEGFYSIKDTIGDLMESDEAWDILKQLAPQVVDRAMPGSLVTLLWVFNKMRAFYKDEDILKINNLLIEIPKQKN